jgi:glycosyltransferase involved in cell wall biosynthesis
VVIIAKDVEATLAQCLHSLERFAEVILYINDCTDETENIAKSYANVRIVHGKFLGFGQSKNKASTFSSYPWILSLDADEVLDEAFVDALVKRELDKHCVYSIERVNFYQEIEVKYCWGKDTIVRLYHKEYTAFDDVKVHEKVQTKGLNQEMLEGKVKHYPYTCMSDFIVKLDRYSTLFAQEKVGKKASSPLKAILNAKYSFVKTYIFKRGFLDGYAGLVIAFSHMATNFYKYMKLYEANKALAKGKK